MNSNSSDDSACLMAKAVLESQIIAQQAVVADLERVYTDLGNKLKEVNAVKDMCSDTYKKTRAIGKVVSISPISDDLTSTEKCINSMSETLDGLMIDCKSDLEAAQKELDSLQAQYDACAC